MKYSKNTFLTFLNDRVTHHSHQQGSNVKSIREGSRFTRTGPTPTHLPKPRLSNSQSPVLFETCKCRPVMVKGWRSQLQPHTRSLFSPSLLLLLRIKDPLFHIVCSLFDNSVSHCVNVRVCCLVLKEDGGCKIERRIAPKNAQQKDSGTHFDSEKCSCETNSNKLFKGFFLFVSKR